MTITKIEISLSAQAHLASLYRIAFSWLGAANGFSPPYQHPVARLLARDQARHRLDEYFAAIEDLVPR